MVAVGIGLSVLLLVFFEVALRIADHCQWVKYERRLPRVIENPSDPKLAAEMAMVMAESVKKYVPNLSKERAVELSVEGKSVSVKTPDDFFKDVYRKHNSTYNIKQLTPQTNTVIYDTWAHFDQWGGRVVPDRPAKSDEQFVFVGCSFTFGEGGQDGQSYPAQFQKLRPKAQVFNFGNPGNSISHALYELTYKFDSRFKNLRIENGTMVYLFMNDHIPRVIAPISTFSPARQWILKGLWYEWDNEKGAVLKGRLFERKLRNAVYSFFESFRLIKILGIEYPSMRSETSTRLFVDMVKKTKQLAAEKANIKKFYFVFHPTFSSISSPELDHALREAGIDVVDLRLAESSSILNKQFFLNLDNHPSPLGNELTARLLDKKLQSQ